MTPRLVRGIEMSQAGERYHVPQKPCLLADLWKGVQPVMSISSVLLQAQGDSE
jgi:hypothetical protein